MEQEKAFIKETITFYRPADAGDRYLNRAEFEFIGKDGVYVVEPKQPPLKD
jgi:hypothetical protein